MNRYWLIALAYLAIACGRPFDVKTAPGFVELEQQNTGYDFRATTPEGVVMSMKVEDAPSDKGADLDFWARSVTLQMRDVQGYALRDAKDVTSRDGTKGKQLRFGHDEGSKPYTYWVTVYVSQDRLFIVEAGGAQRLFDKWTPSLEWMHKSVRVQCNSWVAPVLASHTCNRW